MQPVDREDDFDPYAVPLCDSCGSSACCRAEGERAATERIRSNLQALGFRHEPTGDWVRRDEVLAYLEGEAEA